MSLQTRLMKIILTASFNKIMNMINNLIYVNKGK